MARIALVKTQGGALVPLTDDDKSFIDKKRVGTVLECDFKTVCNPMFHCKFFTLLGLGFDYWNPTGGIVSPAERGLLIRFVRMLSRMVVNCKHCRMWQAATLIIYLSIVPN